MTMRWRRWKYHLNGLLLLLPLVFLGEFIAAREPGPKPGAVSLPDRSVAGCAARLHVEAPAHPEPGGTLDVLLTFPQDCLPEHRILFLAVGESPPDPVPYLLGGNASVLHGGRHNLHAHVPVPEEFRGDEALWLFIEDWQGAFHRTSWPLERLTSS